MRVTLVASVSILIVSMAAGQSGSQLNAAGGNPQPNICRQRHFGDFSAWSDPVNLGAVVNSSVNDQWPAIAPNDLSLYFSSPRAGGLQHIFVTQRSSPTAAWGAPQPLGPNVNSSARDNTPFISQNGHWLFFGSSRSGGCGGNDLYVSFRAETDDDFAWRPATNLGCQVNSPADEVSPDLVVDDDTGTTTLYFVSTRLGAGHIYAAILQPDGTFGQPTLVPELNSHVTVQSSLGGDGPVNIRSDGLQMFLAWSSPAGVFVDADLWTSTRESLAAPWSIPQNLGPALNSSFIDAFPSLSCDGTTLYFGSNRPGGSGGIDLWVAKRTAQ